MSTEKIKQSIEELNMQVEKLEKREKLTFAQLEKIRESCFEIIDITIKMKQLLETSKDDKENKKVIPTEELLKEAETVLIRNTDLENRIVRACNAKNIFTLRQLYEYQNVNKIRGIGEKAQKEIKNVLDNLPETIRKNKERELNIKKHNQKLTLLLPSRICAYLKAIYNITYLEELYKTKELKVDYISDSRYKKIETLLRRY